MNDGNERSFDQFAHFALGRISHELETLSRNAGIPPSILAARVATLLLNSAGGLALGIADTVPTLRGNGTEGSETVGALALASGAYSEAPRKHRLSAAARARIAAAQRKRWKEAKTESKRRARSGWPSTKKARSIEALRRKRVAAEKRGGNATKAA